MAHIRSAPPRTANVAGPPLIARLGAAVDVLITWLDRTRQRRALFGFSDHMLKDIGLSRADVDHEARKAFWRE